MEYPSDSCTGRFTAVPSRAAALGLPVLLVLLGLLGPAAGWLNPAHASGVAFIGQDRVRSELEATDRMLQRAGERLIECTSVRARSLLDQAQGLQDKAWGRFHALIPGSNGDLVLREAEVLTAKARYLALKAMEECQGQVSAQEVLWVLERTRDLGEKAQTVVAASGNAGAQRLLDAGVAQLEKAREAYNARRYPEATQLATTSQTLMQRAMQRVQGAAGPVADLGRVEPTLDRTDQLLAEVQAASGPEDAEKVRALLDLAQTQQDRARLLSRNGRLEESLRWTQRARSTALDALWLLQRAPAAAQVRNALDAVNETASQLSSQIESRGAREAHQLLEKAKEQIAAARSLLDDGKTGPAAQAVRAADSLLRRAAEKSGVR